MNAQPHTMQTEAFNYWSASQRLRRGLRGLRDEDAVEAAHALTELEGIALNSEWTALRTACQKTFDMMPGLRLAQLKPRRESSRG